MTNMWRTTYYLSMPTSRLQHLVTPIETSFHRILTPCVKNHPSREFLNSLRNGVGISRRTPGKGKMSLLLAKTERGIAAGLWKCSLLGFQEVIVNVDNISIHRHRIREILDYIHADQNDEPTMRDLDESRENKSGKVSDVTPSDGNTDNLAVSGKNSDSQTEVSDIESEGLVKLLFTTAEEISSVDPFLTVMEEGMVELPIGLKLNQKSWLDIISGESCYVDSNGFYKPGLALLLECVASSPTYNADEWELHYDIPQEVDDLLLFAHPSNTQSARKCLEQVLQCVTSMQSIASEIEGSLLLSPGSTPVPLDIVIQSKEMSNDLIEFLGFLALIRQSQSLDKPEHLLLNLHFVGLEEEVRTDPLKSFAKSCSSILAVKKLIHSSRKEFGLWLTANRTCPSVPKLIFAHPPRDFVPGCLYQTVHFPRDPIQRIQFALRYLGEVSRKSFVNENTVILTREAFKKPKNKSYDYDNDDDFVDDGMDGEIDDDVDIADEEVDSDENKVQNPVN